MTLDPELLVCNDHGRWSFDYHWSIKDSSIAARVKWAEEQVSIRHPGLPTALQTSIKALLGTNKQAAALSMEKLGSAIKDRYAQVAAYLGPEYTVLTMPRSQTRGIMSALMSIPDASFIGRGSRSKQSQADWAAASQEGFTISEKNTHRTYTWDGLHTDSASKLRQAGKYHLGIASSTHVTLKGLQPHYEMIVAFPADHPKPSDATKMLKMLDELLLTLDASIDDKLSMERNSLHGRMPLDDVKPEKDEAIYRTVTRAHEAIQSSIGKAANDTIQELSTGALKVEPCPPGSAII